MRRPLRRGAYSKKQPIKKFTGLITIVGISSKEFWQWFDLMPKHVRDTLHDPNNSYEKQQQLWAQAVKLYGKEIRAKLNS